MCLLAYYIKRFGVLFVIVVCFVHFFHNLFVRFSIYGQIGLYVWVVYTHIRYVHTDKHVISVTYGAQQSLPGHETPSEHMFALIKQWWKERVDVNRATITTTTTKEKLVG